MTYTAGVDATAWIVDCTARVSIACMGRITDSDIMVVVKGQWRTQGGAQGA